MIKMNDWEDDYDERFIWKKTIASHDEIKAFIRKLLENEMSKWAAEFIKENEHAKRPEKSN